MTMMQLHIAPAGYTGLLKAVDEAARAIPPAFPLTATVAVNPFLGQTGQDLATATALVARVGGTRLTLARSEYAAKRAAGEIENADLEAALLAFVLPQLDDLSRSQQVEITKYLQKNVLKGLTAIRAARIVADTFHAAPEDLMPEESPDDSESIDT